MAKLLKRYEHMIKEIKKKKSAILTSYPPDRYNLTRKEMEELVDRGRHPSKQSKTSEEVVKEFLDVC